MSNIDALLPFMSKEKSEHYLGGFIIINALFAVMAMARKVLLGITFITSVVLLVMTTVAYASEDETTSAKNDYVTCWKQPCVLTAGSKWSQVNPNGVAIAVRMGLKSAATDDQIKMVLTHDFKKYGVDNIKFFYEQNDAPASGIFLHIRGGTEGVFTISDVRQNIKAITERALNKNQLFQ